MEIVPMTMGFFRYFMMLAVNFVSTRVPPVLRGLADQLESLAITIENLSVVHQLPEVREENEISLIKNVIDGLKMIQEYDPTDDSEPKTLDFYVSVFLYDFFELCVKNIRLTDLEKNCVNTNLAIAIDKITEEVSNTHPTTLRVDTGLFIKRSALQFMLDGHSGIQVANKNNGFKRATDTLDDWIYRVATVKIQCYGLTPSVYCENDSDIEEYGCDIVPKTHHWWFIFQQNDGSKRMNRFY